MRIELKVGRQESRAKPGRLAAYSLQSVTPDMSFLEMLDMLNEQLVRQRERPVEFDHDCREGICGQCGVMINGRAHGPLPNTTTCQLHMRTFADGSTIYVEPFRADAFPIKCDLKVDRSAFDRIIQAGAMFRRVPVRHPRRTAFRSVTQPPKRHSMPPPASVA